MFRLDWIYLIQTVQRSITMRSTFHAFWRPQICHEVSYLTSINTGGSPSNSRGRETETYVTCLCLSTGYCFRFTRHKVNNKKTHFHEGGNIKFIYSDEIEKLIYAINKRSPCEKTSITNGYREDTIILCMCLYTFRQRGQQLPSFMIPDNLCLLYMMLLQ